MPQYPVHMEAWSLGLISHNVTELISKTEGVFATGFLIFSPSPLQYFSGEGISLY
jgi:hypothetical protein